MIYLDYAATSFRKPESVQRAFLDCIRRGTANPGRGGHRAAMEAAGIVYRAREAVADLFGGAAENVVFTKNATEALNLAIKGLAPDGGHIVISGMEHNSVRRPVAALQKRGISYTVAQVVPDDSAQTVRNFARAMRPDTGLVVCTAASNVCGLLLPTAEIGALCRVKGIPFIVDAAQIAGIFPVTLESLNADVLCAPGHKSLYAPQGSGFLLSRKGIHFTTTMEGGSGSASGEIGMPEELPERLEAGTLNVPAIAGLAAGCAYAKAHMEENTGRELELIARLIDGLREEGWEVFADFPPEQRSPVVAFRRKGAEVEQTARQLDDMGFALRAGLHCAPLAHETLGTIRTGTVRASLGAFTTAQEIEMLLRACKKL